MQVGLGTLMRTLTVKLFLLLSARTAAAGEDGMNISPLVNTDRRGGAFPIMFLLSDLVHRRSRVNFC